MHDLSYLESLSRKELQSLAKTLHVKANASSSVIIQEILAIKFETQSISEVQHDNVENNEDIEVVEVLPVETIVSSIPNHYSTKEYKIGDMVQALMNDIWVIVEVVRVNKKSLRVVNHQTGWSSSIRSDLIRSLSFVETEITTTRSNESISNPSIPESFDNCDCSNHVNNDEDGGSTSQPSMIEKTSVIDHIIPKLWNSNNVSVRRPVFKASRSTSVLHMKRSSFSNTPLSSRHPSITPKFTKAQIARQEAISRKLRGDDDQSVVAVAQGQTSSIRQITPAQSVGSKTVSISTGPRNSSSVTIPSSSNTHHYSKPTASFTNRLSLSNTPGKNLLKVSIAPSSSQVHKHVVPDFSKAHQKQFERSKSITDFVQRDDKINKKMDTVYHQAVQFGYTASTVAIPRKETSEVITSTTSTTTPQFQARRMPNFKSIHKRSSSVAINTQHLHTGRTPGKENNCMNGNRNIPQSSTLSSSSSSSSVVTVAADANKPTRLTKDTGVTFASNKDIKRQKVQQNNKLNRQTLLDSKRKGMVVMTDHNVSTQLPSSHEIPFVFEVDNNFDAGNITSSSVKKIYATTGFAGPFTQIIDPSEY